MKIRNKITLWIAGAGLLAAFIFSAIIFHELIEQPLEMLDKELDSQAESLIVAFASAKHSQLLPPETTFLNSLVKPYWVKIFSGEQDLVYSSKMAQSVEFPIRKNDRSYNVIAKVPSESKRPEEAAYKNISFRVRILSVPFGGKEYLVHIAKPMEHFQKELIELAITIGAGLICFTLSMMFFGYFTAGRILKPITAINILARDISEKTLNKRIPLGATRDELYALSSSLNQMFDRLQFSFDHQKEFIANASHELKTPIAMQRLFFDEAVQRTDIPENFRRKLVAQSEITLRMTQLVKNLLDLSVLEGNETVDLELVDLTELVRSVWNEFDEIIQSTGIQLSLKVEDAVKLPADKEKTRRMLINLIDNAIKYNVEQECEIRFLLSKTDNKVQIIIANTGQVIPRDELEQVFHQFYRVEKSRSIEHGGSGLGLTIVKRIVALHHGTIEIGSDPDGWVQVTVVLPILPAV